jgi:hypothetical protein
MSMGMALLFEEVEDMITFVYDDYCYGSTW